MKTKTQQFLHPTVGVYRHMILCSSTFVRLNSVYLSGQTATAVAGIGPNAEDQWLRSGNTFVFLSGPKWVWIRSRA